MPINSLYHTWFQRIRELRPNQRITQTRNFVWLIIGIYQSRSVCLTRIAGKIEVVNIVQTRKGVTVRWIPFLRLSIARPGL
jgi:hypothetical protein